MKLIECKLSDIADIVAGQSPESKYYNKNKKGYPFLQGKTDFGKKYPSFSTWCTVAKRITQNKDILLSVRAPVGAVNIAKEEICIGRGIAALRVKEQISYEYVYYFLKFNQHYFKSFETGTTFKAITVQNIRKIPITIPKEYNEQIKIANLLSKIENLLQKREKSIELLDSLAKSTFLDMFGSPVSNNKWALVPLSKMGEINRGISKHRPRNAPELLGGKYPLIQTGDVANSGLYLESYSRTYSELGLEQSKLWEKDTLCITIAANIAKTAILKFDACFPDSIVGMKVNKKNTNNIYMYYIFDSLQKILEKNAPAAAQKNINLEILRKLKIPMPPKDLQEKFANIILKIENTKKIYENSLSELKQLFNSTAQKAFKGELELNIVILEFEDKFPDILDEIVKEEDEKDLHFQKAHREFTKPTVTELEEGEAYGFTMDTKGFKNLIKKTLKYEQTFEELETKMRSKGWVIPYDEDTNKKDKPYTYKDTIFELLKEKQIVQEIREYKKDGELKREILLKAKK